MLDLTQVVPQLPELSAHQADSDRRRRGGLEDARTRLGDAAPDWQAVQGKVAASSTSWLLADWIEPPDVSSSPLVRPMPHAVAAADGSQIVPDRHEPAGLALVNVGGALICYGCEQRPKLVSRPKILFELQENLGEGASAARRLAVERSVQELRMLAELASGVPEGVPGAALYDGSLIFWTLETEEPSYKRDALDELSRQLEAVYSTGAALGSYISRPHARDVVNSLTVSSCTFPQANCDRNCPARSLPPPARAVPPCSGLEHVRDRDLFGALLPAGHRSATFLSRSSILQLYPARHRIGFFYLNVGPEIARVEAPAWVLQEPQQLNLLHAICLDQAQKGAGYPVALAEAHEQAVVRAADRRALQSLIERQMAQNHSASALSRKAASKRLRRV